MRKLKDLISEAFKLFIETNQLTLLDFGCGSKPYQPMIQNYVKSYLGADLSINPNCDIIILDNGKLDLPSNTVDIVLSTQVLEHVNDPLLYLEEARRVLTSTGYLILSTHGYWMYHPDPQDYWRWTSAGLKKIISESGFEIVHFKGMMGRASIGMQLIQDGFIFKIPRILLPIFSCFSQLFILLLDKTTKDKTRNDDAGNYILVARVKP